MKKYTRLESVIKKKLIKESISYGRFRGLSPLSLTNKSIDDTHINEWMNNNFEYVNYDDLMTGVSYDHFTSWSKQRNLGQIDHGSFYSQVELGIKNMGYDLNEEILALEFLIEKTTIPPKPESPDIMKAKQEKFKNILGTPGTPVKQVGSYEPPSGPSTHPQHVKDIIATRDKLKSAETAKADKLKQEIQSRNSIGKKVARGLVRTAEVASNIVAAGIKYNYGMNPFKYNPYTGKPDIKRAIFKKTLPGEHIRRALNIQNKTPNKYDSYDYIDDTPDKKSSKSLFSGLRTRRLGGASHHGGQFRIPSRMGKTMRAPRFRGIPR